MAAALGTLGGETGEVLLLDGSVRQLSHQELVEHFIDRCVPALTASAHKGQAGKIGVVGGSAEYTGAPYFAGMAALRAGADLAHVFCQAAAATAIKSYSPELIVHPVDDDDNGTAALDDWLGRLDALVVGPGLGRSEDMGRLARHAIEASRQRRTPVVVDGDALWFVARQPRLVDGHPTAVLTPNAMELSRLYDAVLGETSLSVEEKQAPERVVQLARALGNVTILRKGGVDFGTDGRSCFACALAGSPRRCGGQGDITAGSIGAFLRWTTGVDGAPPLLVAAYAGVALTKWCSEAAFDKHARSMLTTDMLLEIGPQFAKHFSKA